MNSTERGDHEHHGTIRANTASTIGNFPIVHLGALRKFGVLLDAGRPAKLSGLVGGSTLMRNAP